MKNTFKYLEIYNYFKEKIEKNSFLIPEGIVKWYKLILS